MIIAAGPNPPAVEMKVEVPPVDELLALGDSLHERGEPYESVAWGWPIRYTPAVFGTIVARSRRGMTLPARLEAGVPGLWRGGIEWHRDEPVVWIEGRRVRRREPIHH